MSTAYPTSYDTVTTLYDVVNNASATLAAGYTAGGTTLDLDSASLFPSTGGIIYVGNERTTYTGKTSNQLTGVTALLNNYPSGTAVAMYFDAEHLEVLRDAIIATQARVGVTGDTTAGTLTKRIADLEGAGGETITISNKTSAYTVIAGDLGSVINCTSGTFSVSLTAAATLGDGFHCQVWNTGTGAITIDPNSTETIDGLTTIILRQGEGMQILCNGTNWLTGSLKAPRGYSENITSANPRPVASATNATAIGLNSGNTASQAVTGSGAMALGGSYASGTDSFAAAITNNASTYGATGANSIAMGAGLAKASGARSLAMMNNAQASGDDSIAIGRSATSSGTRGVAIGYGAASTTFGKIAFGGATLSGAGSSQSAKVNLIKSTTNATATVVTSDDGAAAATNQVILPNSSAFAFDGIIVARQQAAGGTASAAWKVEGLIRREANAAATTLVASTVTAIDNTPGWTLALSADTTNGGLAVTFTGAAATNIRTVANIRTVEVIYA